NTPVENELSQIRARAIDVRGAPQLEIAGEPEQRDRRAAAPVLELVDIPLDETAPSRSLERRIGCQLHHVRLAGHARPECAAPEHPGRLRALPIPPPLLADPTPP